MEDNHDRSWMYNRLTDRRQLTQEFLAGLKEFNQFALAHSTNSSRAISCPDSSHRDNLNQYEQLVMDSAGPSIGQYFDPVTHVEPSYMGGETDQHTQPQYMGDDHHPEAHRFYKMLQEAQRLLWEGCEHFENSEDSSLSATLATLSLKTDHHMSEKNYNEMM
ncbi:hypothetical protein K1719_005186 [Acacia pycnantha]|nr:hypothetical protein K1719_005186 [Acacia pycnantha]